MLRNNKNIIKEYHAVFTKEMIKESLFVLDANCLLFPLKDYIIGDKILTALESIKGRTYIPFITQVEFLENEITVLADRKGNIARSDKAIHEIKDKDKLLNLEIRNHIQNKLFNSIEKVKNEDNMRSLYKKIVKFKKQYFEQIEGVLDKVDDFLQDIEKELLLKKNKIQEQFDWPRYTVIEDIREQLFKWLDSVQLGTAYDSDTLTRYREQIAKRYEKKVSPGFMDLESKKGQVIQLGTQTLERGYSDAVFWLDILDYINSKSFKQYKYLVIVSNETKPDWVINKEPSKLKIDLFTECHEETGLIARKMSIWELLKLTNSATKDEISESKLLAKDYNFSLYGEFYAADNQARMMEKIFEKILSRVDASMFSIPCILSTSDSSWEEQKNSTFDRYIIISDKSSKDYAVGTSLNFLQKLRYIYDLLEQRHAGSSGQLKFSNIENQEQWEEICQKRRVG